MQEVLQIDSVPYGTTTPRPRAPDITFPIKVRQKRAQAKIIGRSLKVQEKLSELTSNNAGHSNLANKFTKL